MEFRMLGPVEVYAAGRRTDVGPPRQRTVLAALAVDAGHAVPMDTLVDRVWGAEPPERARHALYVYVSRLRALLDTAEPPADGHRLARRTGGYVLDVEPATVDAHRFLRLAEEARQPARAQEERLARWRAAMGLWRGPLIADLSGDWVERVRESWQRRRIEGALAWADAELAAGSPRAIPLLTELVAEHPLTEPLAAALMRALEVTGSRADALRCFDTVSRHLDEQVGLGPGPELQRLHGAIVRLVVQPAAAQPADLRPATGLPPAADRPATAPPATHPVPRQLPLDPPGFTGRAAELARLDGILARHRSEVPIATVSGAPGVGKTALAVHWAHRVTGAFPDGQLYVDLRGFSAVEPAFDPAAAVRGFLDALGVPGARMPVTAQGQVGLYRSLLAGRRMLLVLDNARDADQVRPLLPGEPGCAVVVTSRTGLSGLVSAEGARPVGLGLLPADAAAQLLAHRLGERRIAADPDAAAELVELCTGLPVALVVVASRALSRPDQPLHRLAGELQESRSGLAAFAGDPGTDLRAVFSWSYRLLSAPAARLFRLSGLAPGTDLAAPAVASLIGLDRDEVRALLAELVRANLVTESVDGRYGAHDLLRAYAVELAGAVDPGADRRAALLRLIDHYLHSAHAAARRLNERRDPLEPPDPVPGVTPERPVDAAAALAWLAAERHVLLAAVQRAADAGADSRVWPLAWCLTDFFERQGQWQDWVSVQRAGLAAAGRLGDERSLARAHRGLGRAYARLGHDGEAIEQLDRARRLQRRCGDWDGLGHTELTLAWVTGHRGRLREALRHAERALAAFRASGHRAGVANALNSVGFSRAQLGDHEPALAACTEALALLQELGDREGEATTWDSIGYVQHCLGRYADAVRCYRRALDRYAELADRHGEAETLTRLGDTYVATGQPDAARAVWRQTIELRAGLGDPDPADVRSRLTALDRSVRQPLPG